MKQMDDNIGVVLKKLEDMGQLDNTIVVFTTDNGAEAITFPDGGVTPFKGQKGEAWEGGYRAPCVIRWPGHIKPGTVKNQLFAALDWVPTLVDIAGGPKGDGLKTADRGRPISRHRQDYARRRQPARLPRRHVGEFGARLLLLFLGRRRRPRCATRTGRCTTAWLSRGRRLGSAARHLSLHRGAEHQARPVRTDHRSSPGEVGAQHWRFTRCANERLSVRLQHSACRSDVVAAAPGDVQDISCCCRRPDLDGILKEMQSANKHPK